MAIEDAVMISLPQRVNRRTGFWQNFPDDWPLPVPRVLDAFEGGMEGCRLSHLAVLQEAIEARRGSLLVLEDDAVFARDFSARVQMFLATVPDDWAMLMLGGQHQQVPRQVMPGLVRCVSTFRTHAYVVRDAAMAPLHDLWTASTGHIDHDLHRLQEVLPVYAPQPFLVGQAAGFSDISHRAQPVRFW